MKNVKKYGITIAVGLLAVLVVAWAMGLFRMSHPVWVLHILCDAFFAVGAVFLGLGLLVYVSNEGTFDMAVYGVKSLFGAFRKDSVKQYDTYYDYREARAERKVSFGFLLVCSGLFLAVALVLYYCYSQYR